eukprot:c8994_g1_i1.p2 GENE.c8994_g1_i1~~c8994_g1_i1.p2  ORF type:complete len:170 (-),score=42.08 c8994_g1_i1:354-863(-)
MERGSSEEDKDSKEALRKCYPRLTDQLLDEYKAAYALFDADGDGEISREDIQATMKKVGIARGLPQIEEIISRITLDSSGVLTYKDFVKLMQMQRNESVELKKAFDMIDKEHKGEITLSDLRDAFTITNHPISDEELKFLMQSIDENKDGVVDFPEFMNMMRFGGAHHS